MLTTNGDADGSQSPLIVWLEPPFVAGEMVAFSWTQSELNPFQAENSFFLRYENTDLSKLPESLFYEIFFCYQLQVFRLYRRPVTIVCPAAIWEPGFKFWRRYHGARQVTLQMEGGSAAAPLRGFSLPAPEPAVRAAVLFGGGKDSTCIASMLGEALGNDQVLLINFVEPRRVHSRANLGAIETRREKLLLEPMRSLGFPTQRVWTDFLAIQRPEHRRSLLVHYHFYLVGALPIYLQHGTRVATIANERSDYRVSGNLTRDYRFGRSRPEWFDAQHQHLRRLGIDIRLTNFNYLFTGLMAAKLLASRYPAAFSEVLMCMHATLYQRWCLQCMKCGNYAFYSLFAGYVDPEFDYDAFFAHSDYVRQLLDDVKLNSTRLDHGNAPWRKSLCYPDHFEQFCHAIALLDPDLIMPRLGTVAREHLSQLRCLFGNRVFPESEIVYQDAIDSLEKVSPPDLLSRFVHIAGEHFAFTERPAEPFWLGNEVASFDFRFVMPTSPVTPARAPVAVAETETT